MSWKRHLAIAGSVRRSLERPCFHNGPVLEIEICDLEASWNELEAESRLCLIQEKSKRLVSIMVPFIKRENMRAGKELETESLCSLFNLKIPRKDLVSIMVSFRTGNLRTRNELETESLRCFFNLQSQQKTLFP